MYLINAKQSKIPNTTNRLLDSVYYVHQLGLTEQDLRFFDADVNGKVTELEPVVKAAADLGESVSDINSSSRRMIERFSGMGIRGAGIGIFSSLVSRMFARRKRRRGED